MQFKSSSVRTVEYSAHEYEWFHSMSLPLFIGSVDLSRQEMSMHTTHRLASHVNARDFDSAVLHLDRPAEALSTDMTQIWLGPPILQWTMEQGESGDFKCHAYDILKRWLAIEYANLGMRHIRTQKLVTKWQTNKLPEQVMTAMLGNVDEISQDLAAAMPYLKKLATHILTSDKEDQVSFEALGLYLLATWMRGHDITDSKLLVQLMAHKMGFDEGDFRLQLDIQGSNRLDNVTPTDKDSS